MSIYYVLVNNYYVLANIYIVLARIFTNVLANKYYVIGEERTRI